MRITLLFLGVACALGAISGLAAEKKASAEGQSMPQLLSRGARWKNVDQLKKFAAEGDTLACLELGERLLYGDGLAQDEAAARLWFAKAGEAGSGDALFRLGRMHHDGVGGPRDYAAALGYYLRAAQAGIPEAQHNLGAMFASARGVRRDFVEGLAWFIVATKSGAVSDAESRTRERLKKRPADIAQAEVRAQELLALIESGGEIMLPTAIPLPRAAQPVPVVTPLRTAPPAVKIERPKIEPPRVEAPATMPSRN